MLRAAGALSDDAAVADASTAAPQQAATESLDFNEIESAAWRQHVTRRFFQERGLWAHLTSHRAKDLKLWALIIGTGFCVACTGAFVIQLTDSLFAWKFAIVRRLVEQDQVGHAFGAFLFMNLFFALVAGLLCALLPEAAGSGIPEVIALLNGVKLDKVVSVPVLIAKVIGMCFSVASGLPLGKEGPMIHAGSIIGAVVSQSWLPQCPGLGCAGDLQELHNDYTKRDFITVGAAAGVAAAFKAPIGGILFTLEEGASFWSLDLTVRAFICAAITQLTISLIFANNTGASLGSFAFGQFDTLVDGRANYYTYELLAFIAIGGLGGLVGALFNHIHVRVSALRRKHLSSHRWRRLLELAALSLLVSLVSFVLPLMWSACTPIKHQPTNVQERYLQGELVRFACPSDRYNELASLFLAPSDVGMQQLFHTRELDGAGRDSLGFGPLLLFFLSYFLLAAVTPGVLAPAGLFIPTLFAGAAMGRIVGHMMNYASPGRVADAGTYALIGSAAVLGGMSRMTISGTVIILEACGNASYLLPLMLTFSAARYVGNMFNASLYDIQLKLRDYPFLPGEPCAIGLMGVAEVGRVMAAHVVAVNEVESVRNLVAALSKTKHNGFPVVRAGRLQGLVLRKTLCQLLKLRAFSSYVAARGGAEGLELQADATIFYGTLEKGYPDYPAIEDVALSDADMAKFVDVRTYMDASPHTVDVTCSVQKAYRLFRTMGLRHLVVLDADHLVRGVITRKDLVQSRIEELWDAENQHTDAPATPEGDPEDPAPARQDDSLRPLRKASLASTAF